MEKLFNTESPLTESNGTSVRYYDLYPDVYTGVQHENDEGPIIPLTIEQFNEYIFVLRFFLIPIASVIGTFGSVYGLYVLRRDATSQKNNFFFYMFALLFGNAVQCVIDLMYDVPWIIMSYDVDFGKRLEKYFVQTTVYIGKIFNHFAASLLIQMSSERLFSLQQPFSFQQIWLFKHPRRGSLIAFIIYSICLLPFPLCCVVTPIQESNKTVLALVLRDPDWGILMDNYLFYQAIFISIALPIIILILNASIPLAYYRYIKNAEMKSKMKNDSKRRQQQTKITIVTLSTAISYFILSTPNMLAFALDYYDTEYSYFGKFSYIFNFFITLGTFLTNINAMFDCIIYVAVSSEAWQKFTTWCFGSSEQVTRNTTEDSISGNQTTGRTVAL